MSDKYEPIKFNSWQELAKYVIDGGDVYYKSLHDGSYIKIMFIDNGFNCLIRGLAGDSVCKIFTKKKSTLEELIAIKPRLCWVKSGGRRYLKLIISADRGGYCSDNALVYDNAQMLTDDEIKQFLSGGE